MLTKIAAGLKKQGPPNIAVVGVQELMSLNTKGFIEHGVKRLTRKEDPMDVLARNLLSVMKEVTHES